MLALRYSLLALLLVVGLAVHGANGTESTATEAEILRLEQQFIDTIPNRGRGMKALLDRDFFYNTSAGSRLTGAMLLDYLATSDLQVEDIRHESLQIYGQQDHAVVEGVVLVRLIHGGELIEQRARFLHLWRRQPEGWKLFARQVTTVRQ